MITVTTLGYSVIAPLPPSIMKPMMPPMRMLPSDQGWNLDATAVLVAASCSFLHSTARSFQPLSMMTEDGVELMAASCLPSRATVQAAPLGSDSTVSPWDVPVTMVAQPERNSNGTPIAATRTWSVFMLNLPCGTAAGCGVVVAPLWESPGSTLLYRMTVVGIHERRGDAVRAPCIRP